MLVGMLFFYMGGKNFRGIYEGNWENDQRHGSGVMHYEDGDLYEGEWIEDKREGYGVMKFVDNLKYQGEFKGDALNGKGTLYDKDDNILYEGLWRNSKPFSEEEMLRQESLYCVMEETADDNPRATIPDEKEGQSILPAYQHPTTILRK